MPADVPSCGTRSINRYLPTAPPLQSRTQSTLRSRVCQAPQGRLGSLARTRGPSRTRRQGDREPLETSAHLGGGPGNRARVSFVIPNSLPCARRHAVSGRTAATDDHIARATIILTHTFGMAPSVWHPRASRYPPRAIVTTSQPVALYRRLPGLSGQRSKNAGIHPKTVSRHPSGAVHRQ